MATKEIGTSTSAMIVLFGCNALLWVFFQYMRYLEENSRLKTIDSDEKTSSAIAKTGEHKKELSKPFTPTVDGFTFLTRDFAKLGFIMALTYVCENHWIFPHSQKEYSRDLFMFIVALFFIYGFYTIKPTKDLTLLSRDQTEEWKGWMQFIFLLYHYFHAEEVYNSVRIMITCYVWMTGFGNFSFFYIKQDFGWLRVMQMMWRLNFAVLFLMWTHGNTYILYYICPLHTFYFMMVYCTMYCFSNINHTKYGIRAKLMVLGIILFIVWDLNSNIFDAIFGWVLGTDKIIGAGRGSLWEYYFRTSLDHYSSFLGMIFALNFPLAEQYFNKAKGYSLMVTAVVMAAITVYWYSNYYVLSKLEYNMHHSYWAIVPLTSYIFFRNITPQVRSGISMSMHVLGKTTLETYLLQHHIWLTSNAKTLLTIVPGHPYLNFIFATILFYIVSKELYGLTMSLRGMILPEDPAIAWTNMIGMACVVAIGGACAFSLHAVGMHSIYSGLCVASLLFAVCLVVINKFCPNVSKLSSFSQMYSTGMLIAGGLSVLLLILHFATMSYDFAPVEVIAVVSNPKPTGSMSYPQYGAGVLVLAAVMLFTMDNFLGLGWLGLVVFGRSYDWDEAYAPLHRTIVGHPSHPGSNKQATKQQPPEEEEMQILIAEDGGAAAVKTAEI